MGTRHFATREKVVKSLKELRIKVVCSEKGEDPSYEGIREGFMVGQCLQWVPRLKDGAGWWNEECKGNHWPESVTHPPGSSVSARRTHTLQDSEGVRAECLPRSNSQVRKGHCPVGYWEACLCGDFQKKTRETWVGRVSKPRRKRGWRGRAPWGAWGKTWFSCSWLRNALFRPSHSEVVQQTGTACLQKAVICVSLIPGSVVAFTSLVSSRAHTMGRVGGTSLRPPQWKTLLNC